MITIFEDGGVNLDGEHIDDLRAFGNDPSAVKKAGLLRNLPAEIRTRYIARLATYARVKTQAIEHRQNGNIRIALVFEAQAQRVYDSLPDDVQW